ncbi:hypothetical protein ADICYQ_5146 [Cyclobacterium qasimii M12-11B]|uniref:Uncharacterized protein n=1 Tax=Cyclobacterium qasimii M12-11B TaxID=641524 RepID=S7WNR5_9BACT|nr:hypothetical protein ADICYQ_5146 [Cyclobacterium qasimii M12-11B]
MGSNKLIPKTISSRVEFKRKFSLQEMYRAAVFAPRAMSKLGTNKKVNWSVKIL